MTDSDFAKHIAPLCDAIKMMIGDDVAVAIMDKSIPHAHDLAMRKAFVYGCTGSVRDTLIRYARLIDRCGYYDFDHYTWESTA